jgi:hypothetical protein
VELFQGPNKIDLAPEAERTGQSQMCVDTHFIQDSCPEDAATCVGHVVLSSTLQPMHGPLDFQDVIHNAMEDIEEVKDAGQQRSSRASGEEFSSASIVNNTDGHSAELARVNTETADDGDWLTVSLYNSKRQGSNNKRVTASCLDERKPGGLSAAFKANGSPDEHLLQLGEEFESSRHSMPKGQSLITKRLITLITISSLTMLETERCPLFWFSSYDIFNIIWCLSLRWLPAQ